MPWLTVCLLPSEGTEPLLGDAMCKLIVDKPGRILYSGTKAPLKGGQQPKRNKTIILLIERRRVIVALVGWRFAADYFFFDCRQRNKIKILLRSQ